MRQNDTQEVITLMDHADKKVKEALSKFTHVDTEDDAKKELHLISQRINLVRADMFSRLSLLAQAEAVCQKDKAEGNEPVPLAPNICCTKKADGCCDEVADGEQPTEADAG